MARGNRLHRVVRGAVARLNSGLLLACIAFYLTPAAAESAQAPEVQRGEYVARAADCMSCHTAPGGQPFAGGNSLKSPLGTLYGANITPDPQTGIGSWDKADFERALRRGIAKGGEYLYPAMPYDSYTKMTEEDIDALWAYLRTIPAVHNQVPKNSLPFPLNIREGLAAWQSLYFKPGAFEPVNGKSASWNRGAYLVQALGHCADCHTPRNAAQGLELQHQLTGAAIEGWYAADISGDAQSTVTTHSAHDLETYFHTGVMPGNTKAAGPMQEVVQDSLRYLTETDIRAITEYLKDQPGNARPQRPTPVKYDRSAAGQQVYENECLSCHQSNGQGKHATVPALAGNDLVTTEEPYNVIMAVLEGFEPHGTWGAMASFAGRLSDEQIADVTNYVRTAWGNHAPPNATPWSVQTWRSKAPQTKTEAHALLCPTLKVGIIKPALALGPDRLRQAAANRTQMTQAVRSYRSAVPGASTSDVLQALSTAYCRAIAEDHISDALMAERLEEFAQSASVVLAGRPHG